VRGPVGRTIIGVVVVVACKGKVSTSVFECAVITATAGTVLLEEELVVSIASAKGLPSNVTALLLVSGLDTDGTVESAKGLPLETETVGRAAGLGGTGSVGVECNDVGRGARLLLGGRAGEESEGGASALAKAARIVLMSLLTAAVIRRQA